MATVTLDEPVNGYSNVS